VAETKTQPRLLRFGNFEVNPLAGELRKAGMKLKLSSQPFELLTVLLENAGQVMTREQLRERLWPDSFVDFDHSLNKAINKIREVLGDSAESPRFIETMPKRGYRFIAPVDTGIDSADSVPKKPLPPAAVKPSRSRFPVYGLALLGLVLTVAGLVTWRAAFSVPASPKVLRFTQLTEDGLPKYSPAFTDGSRLYFTDWFPDGRTAVFQVSVKGGQATSIAIPLKQPSLLDLSRDGTELLIGDSESNGLLSFWIQQVEGGSPRRVGDVLGRDARFTPSGDSILYSEPNGAFSVHRDGSSLRRLLATNTPPFSFDFSPDGTRIRFVLFDAHTETPTMMEIASDGTGLRQLGRGGFGKWTADGQFVFQKTVDGRVDLWIWSQGKRFLRGDQKPTRLTTGPLDFRYPMPSPDGKKIFAIGTASRTEIVRYDTKTRKFGPYLSGISAEGLAFSPDGQWVAYVSYPDRTLWRSKVDGSERVQLTFSPLQAFLPRWSHDAKQIAFSGKLPDTAWNIYLVASDGGTPQRVHASEQSQMDVNWSPNGKLLMFASVYGVEGPPISILDLASNRVDSLPGSNGLFSPHWSPDGRYVAAITSDPSSQLMLFDFATQKWSTAFASPTGYETWSHDGAYLYFMGSSQHIADQVLRLRLSDHKVETVLKLNAIGRTSDGGYGAWFGLAPDDAPLVSRDIGSHEIYALEIGSP
jgi:Tol biopolymer transport system component/DNA-binding winged helix-turn-helix (wHTH) protein